MMKRLRSFWAKCGSQEKQNNNLAKKYRIRGYPTIILINEKGDVIARTGYRRGGPDKYVEHLKELIAQETN